MQDSRAGGFRLGAAGTSLPFDFCGTADPTRASLQKCVHAFQPLGPENEFIGIISPGSWTK